MLGRCVASAVLPCTCQPTTAASPFPCPSLFLPPAMPSCSRPLTHTTPFGAQHPLRAVLRLSCACSPLSLSLLPHVTPFPFPSSKQVSVYEESAKPIVDDVLDGFNGILRPRPHLAAPGAGTCFSDPATSRAARNHFRLRPNGHRQDIYHERCGTGAAMSSDRAAAASTALRSPSPRSPFPQTSEARSPPPRPSGERKPGMLGIIPQAFDHIFNAISESEGVCVCVP